MPATLRISAQVDYAIRSIVELSAAPPGRWVPAEELAAAQAIPVSFLLTILRNLRAAGVIDSRRGHGGGYLLSRSTADLTLAEIIAAVDPPIAEKSWMRQVVAPGSLAAESVHDVWIGLRGRIQAVLEQMTVADVVGARRAEEQAGAGLVTR